MTTPQDFKHLRAKHPVFRYQSYAFARVERELIVTFNFRIDPDLNFSPKVRIPLPLTDANIPIETFIFHLGLIEMISYWKAACPARLIVEAGQLNAGQISWWHDLILHGLGEFYYRNGIDFSKSDFLTIESVSAIKHQAVHLPSQEGELIMAGGGKDSSLALELLKESPARTRRAFVLNPIRSAIESVKIAGYSEPLIAHRAIDPKLLALNAAGYLNGHTPFSAYLAFLGSFVAAIHGLQFVIAANEQSANEANVELYGMPINHQYSKSYRFEKRFREYAAQHLSPEVKYFSLLRPIGDITVSKLFAQQQQHFASFRSCNAGQKTDSWCGRCPKCAFVYLTLFPFAPEDALQNIFGEDLFLRPEIITHLRQLVKLESTKPFECVGTIEESRAALTLCIQKIHSSGKTVPPALVSIEAGLACEKAPPADSVIKKWSDEHFLLPEYERLLRNALQESR